MAKNFIVNGDFQAGWTTLGNGNQVPQAWALTVTPNGQANLWPTKIQGGARVPSVAERQPEHVFKLRQQLPLLEQFGQSQSLFVFDTQQQVFKIFHGPSSWRLAQRAKGLAKNATARLNAWVCADTQDVARGPSGMLETDHCLLMVGLRGAEEHSELRNWQGLSEHADLAGSSKRWNKFVLDCQADANGEIEIFIQGQQNWTDDPSGVAWFLGPMWLEEVGASTPAPIPTPPANDELAKLQAEVARLNAEIAQSNLRLNALNGRYGATLESLHDTIAVVIANLERLREDLAKQLAEVRR